jgi:hypothetical protein
MSTRESIRRSSVTVSIQLGIAAAFVVNALQPSVPFLRIVGDALTSCFSQLLAGLLRWDQHTRVHHPAGMWLTYVVLSVVSAAFLFPVVRFMLDRWSSNAGLRWIPGILSVAVPWLVWSHTSAIHLGGLSTGMRFAILVLVLLGAGIGLAASWVAMTSPRTTQRMLAFVAVLASLLLCASLAYWVHDVYAWPLVSGIVLVSTLFLAVSGPVPFGPLRK